MTEMPAAVIEAPGRELTVEAVELAEPGPGEARVRIEASGVCHSDWNAATGASITPMPAVLGHEGAGVVEEVGPGVSLVRPGDRVVLSWLPWCGRCAPCLRGELSLCAVAMNEMGDGSLPGGGFRLSRNGERIYHYSYLSTFARYAVVHERSCIVLPDGADLSVAALVGCAVMTGMGAILNKARVTPGSSVAVFGAGGVGLSAAMAARFVGAEQVIVVDTIAAKAELASQMGATHVVTASGDMAEELIREIAPRGVDYAVEATGLPRVATAAFNSTRRGGMLVMIGLAPEGVDVSFPAALLVRSERVVTGTLYGSSRPPLDMPMLMRLHAEGRLPLEKLITTRYPLEKVNEAFDDMRRGRVVRGVLIPWEETPNADR